MNRLTGSTGSRVFPGMLSYNFPLTIDRWGNATCNTAGNPGGPGLTCSNIAFNNSNQISTIGSVSASYDAAGNLTSDGTHSYQWDAENHLKSIDNGTNGTLTYNAYGWRVYNSSGSGSYLHDPSGQLIGGNWASGAAWNAGIRFGSRLLAMYGGDSAHTAYFTHANALGSETQTTDYAGNGGQAVLYFPSGQKMSVSSSLYGSTYYQFFASLELYDTATDGYVPPFRYYIPNQGRWLTPDLLGGDITNPRSLNRYAYVGNNPASFTDPSGLFRWVRTRAFRETVFGDPRVHHQRFFRPMYSSLLRPRLPSPSHTP